VLAVGDAHDDDSLRVSGALLSGMVRAARGEHVAACRMLESGIAACERMGQVPHGLFVVDPFTQLHANIAVPLMALGRGDEARRHIAAAQARATAVGQPTARMLSLWVDGMVNVRAENPAQVLACATSLAEVVDKSMLTQGGGPARWLRGWATAHLGDPLAGHRLIREGYAIYESLGMFAGNTETLGYAAKALMLAGDWAQADRVLDEGQALADRIHEHVAYPYLLRLRAEIALQYSRDRARELWLQSLAMAREQGAPYDELKVLVSLCKHGLENNSERDALRRLFDSLTQARDLPFMRRAAGFLA